MSFFSVAIDGPSGAGKSTIARLAARRLDFIYVDTGALYRAVAYQARIANISPELPETEFAEKVEALLPDITLEFKLPITNGVAFAVGIQDFHIFLNGKDAEPFIREPEISLLASKVAALPAVRDFLMEYQRSFAEEHNVIMEGRDIGTVVLPDADFKLYLDATPEERAGRRFRELTIAAVKKKEAAERAKAAEKAAKKEASKLKGQAVSITPGGIKIEMPDSDESASDLTVEQAESQESEQLTYEKVLADIQARDEADSTREIAPLEVAEDAQVLSTTGVGIEGIVGQVVLMTETRMRLKARDEEEAALQALLNPPEAEDFVPETDQNADQNEAPAKNETAAETTPAESEPDTPEAKA
ncbi:hypothetical protein FACS189499_07020 [Clostridia bacterium]|nr:hypothetical protein FACS189499_07020 [Clostridia bacterium]